MLSLGLGLVSFGLGLGLSLEPRGLVSITDCYTRALHLTLLYSNEGIL